MLRTLFKQALDLVIPPRKTEIVARTLTLDDLFTMRTDDGLPYKDASVRAFIWELKYYAGGDSLKIAGEYLADELLALAAEEVGTPLLIPVPMHSTRRRERGHNHTELLCEAAMRAMQSGVRKNSLAWLAGSFGLHRRSEDFFSGTAPALPGSHGFAPLRDASALHYCPQALWRTTYTKTQQGLPKAVRLKNVAHSMEADPALVKGRVCIVVDDVMTTGATLNEAKRALRSAGARVVHTIALAKS